MDSTLTSIKRKVSSAETFLEKAKREYAYYKNGSPYPPGKVPNDNETHHYLASQNAYTAAKKYAEGALELLKKTPNAELETRAKKVLDECNKKKGDR